MRAKRSRARKKAAPPHEAWQDLLYGSSSAKLVAIAASVTAALYLFGVFKPLADSGPPPFPARAEVDQLRQDTKQGLADTNMGLAETLEVAKAANVAAQQALIAGNENRLTRLLQQSVQIQSLIDMNPENQSLKLLLEQTKNEIARLSAAPTKAAPSK